MTWLSDAIVIDTAELRAAAAALREAERGTVELGLRLPREASAAPDWLASSAADGLGLARRELDELGAELRAESKRLDARADEVDSAEQRWWEIANGEIRCGCVLPSGTLVAQPGQFTAASSASGLGTGDAGAFIDVSAISAPAAAGLGVTVIGGGSDLPVDIGGGSGYIGGPTLSSAISSVYATRPLIGTDQDYFHTASGATIVDSASNYPDESPVNP